MRLPHNFDQESYGLFIVSILTMLAMVIMVL